MREFGTKKEDGKIYENVRLIMNDNNLTVNYVCIVNSPGKYLLEIDVAGSKEAFMRCKAWVNDDKVTNIISRGVKFRHKIFLK
jgi:hypothetical protein